MRVFNLIVDLDLATKGDILMPPNEWIGVESLQETVRVYAIVVKRFCM